MAIKFTGADAAVFKQITDSAAGAKRYSADRIVAEIEGIGTVTLYIKAYGAKPEQATDKPVTKPNGDARAKAPTKPAPVVSAPVAAPNELLKKLGIGSVEELKALKALLAG